MSVGGIEGGGGTLVNGFRLRESITEPGFSK